MKNEPHSMVRINNKTLNMLRKRKQEIRDETGIFMSYKYIIHEILVENERLRKEVDNERKLLTLANQIQELRMYIDDLHEQAKRP